MSSGLVPYRQQIPRIMPEQGALGTMVEFPAVAEGCARFRLQVMAGHELEQTQKAAQ